jgi:hypothetical protein
MPGSGTQAGGVPTRIDQTRQQWVSASDQGRLDVGAETIVSLGAPPTTTVPGHVATPGAPMTHPFAQYFTYAQLQGLPGDADSLRGAIQSASRIQPADEALVVRVAADLLALPPTPPAVKGAAWDLLAQDGFAVTGDAQDPDGRAGTGVAGVTSGLRTEIVVDGDGHVLGYRQVVEPGGSPVVAGAVPGSMPAFVAYERTDLVNGVGT